MEPSLFSAKSEKGVWIIVGHLSCLPPTAWLQNNVVYITAWHFEDGRINIMRIVLWNHQTMVVAAQGSLNKAFVLNSKTSLFIAKPSVSVCEVQRTPNKSNKLSQSIIQGHECVWISVTSAETQRKMRLCIIWRGHKCARLLMSVRKGYN